MPNRSNPTAGENPPAEPDCSLSYKDVNCPTSLPTPADGLGPIPNDYRDPERDGINRKDWSPYRLRLNHMIRENFWDLWRRYRPAQIVYFTTTSQNAGDPAFDSLAAQRELKAASEILDRVFLEWFCVLEFNLDGIPHHHGFGAATGNIRWGWNQSRWEALQNNNIGFETVAEPGNQLTTNQRLVAIWRKFNQHYPGRVNAVPCLYPKKAIAYATHDLDKPSGKQPRWKRGTRLFIHSRNCRLRVVSTQFGWNTELVQLLRRKKTTIASALYVSVDRCKLLFGPSRYEWHLQKLIGALDRQSPRWFELDRQTIEDAVINGLADLHYGWSDQLAVDLAQRRYRRLNGLDPDSSPRAPEVRPPW